VEVESGLVYIIYLPTCLIYLSIMLYRNTITVASHVNYMLDPCTHNLYNAHHVLILRHILTVQARDNDCVGND